MSSQLAARPTLNGELDGETLLRAGFALICLSSPVIEALPFHHFDVLKLVPQALFGARTPLINNLGRNGLERGTFDPSDEPSSQGFTAMRDPRALFKTFTGIETFA